MTLKKRQSFQQIILTLEELEIPMQREKKNESRHRPCTLRKNELKLNHRSKCKTRNYETPRG